MLSLHRAWDNGKIWHIVDEITVSVLLPAYIYFLKSVWIIWPGRLWVHWPATPVRRTKWRKKSLQKSEVRSLTPNSSPARQTHSQASIFTNMPNPSEKLCSNSTNRTSHQEGNNAKVPTTLSPQATVSPKLQLRTVFPDLLTPFRTYQHYRTSVSM